MKLQPSDIKKILYSVYEKSEISPNDYISESDIAEIIENADGDYQQISDDIKDHLVEQDDLFNVEIIYYSKAMEYLSENDASLHDSLALAYDCGYELKNLNSEILASLLASNNSRDDFENLWDDVETEILAYDNQNKSEVK